MMHPAQESSDEALRALAARTEQLHAEITRPIHVECLGISLRVDPGVFNPGLSNVGDLLASHMEIEPGASVLDLGTGSGFQALVAARTASRVVASDRQPEAARCAEHNVRVYGLEDRIAVRCGDLFDALEPHETFDVIVFNFPFIPWEPKTEWQRANSDHENRTLTRFLHEGRLRLEPSGRIVMTWADIGGLAIFERLTDQFGFTRRKVAERGPIGLQHYIFELRPGLEGDAP